jgi:hypothetical protein
VTIFGSVFATCLVAGACGPIGGDGTTSLAPEAAAPAPTVDSGTDSGVAADTGTSAGDSGGGEDAPADALVASDASVE